MDDKEFKQWESDIFGFGYGSGEESTLTALKDFFSLSPVKGNYDYAMMEKAMGKTIFWLMLTILARAHRVIEYGTSPRYGWLDEKGVRLKEYLKNKTVEHLYEIVMAEDTP